MRKASARSRQARTASRPGPGRGSVSSEGRSEGTGDTGGSGSDTGIASGKTTRHRLNRGGNRQANAALYRVVITRMRGHPPTLAYVAKRLAEGRTKRDIVRCLKRYVAREIFGHLCGPKLRAECRPEAA